MTNFSVVFMTLSLCLLGAAQTYQQVWADEFNGNSLDLSKWQFEVNCDGGGNNELQCYTNSPNNLAVQNGSLVITAIPQNYNGKQYTSARITTAASAAWKYGRFDFRAKMPNGQYLWPALWMMPRDNTYGWWAASGEIDIMEHRGLTNQQESTLHFGGSWPNNVYKGSGPTTMNFNMMDYHIYSLIWTPEKMDFLVDNNVYYTQTLQRSFWSGQGNNPYTADGQPFDQQFFIIINMAIGGGFFGPNANSLTVQQAQNWVDPKFYVDYVRVSQLTSATAAASTSSSSTPNPATSTTAAPVNVNPSPAPAPSANSGGCPVGACGGAACCNDQRNGVQCYDRAVYSCPVDGANGKNGLCAGSAAVCNGGCYDPKTYSCVNGGLVYGAVAAQPTPTSKAATTAAATTSATPTTSSSKLAAATTAATPTSASSKLVTASYCTAGTYACGAACYATSQYCCVNGGLVQKSFCPAQ